MSYKTRKLKKLFGPKVTGANGIETIVPQKRFTSLLLAILFTFLYTAAVAFNPLEKDVLPASSMLFGYFISIAILMSVLGLYARNYHKRLTESPIEIFFILLINLLLILSVQFIYYIHGYISFTPLILTSILISVAFSRRLAIFMLFIQIALLGLITKAGHSRHYTMLLPLEAPYIFAAFIPGCILAVNGSVKIRNRLKLLNVGIVSGIMTFISIYALHLIFNGWEALDLRTHDGRAIFSTAGWAFANGTITGFVATGLLPLLEGIFEISTDLRLLEVSDLNQPLLKKLSMEAPGTYHHSLTVANLAESAAEEIGANALLARTGAYYHDIGKLNRPEYFAENEFQKVGKHGRLSPSMSALIIKAHVKDGIELAEYFRLPKVIIKFIPEHHGTNMLEYFHKEAMTAAKDDAENQVSEDTFRYSGPKPSSKETAIVHLADSVEAGARALAEPNPANIAVLVKEIIMKKLSDGQLDECNLTLKDLAIVQSAFIRVLTGVYHSRVKSPPSTIEETI
ncbi:MAG: HDIG domain-containing protein [Planctomycetes bacterium]|nr:HDIG domain-containing protein [Planctomycetota bacterium]